MTKISDVVITPLKQKHGGLVAIAKMTINDEIVIDGVGVHEKLDGSGFRLTYPTKRTGDRVFNVCHPVTPQLSKIIEHEIFQKLKTVINEGRNHHEPKHTFQS